jgi:hypothetical protein
VIRADHDQPSDDVPLTRIVTQTPEHVVRVILNDDLGVTDLRVEGASLEEAVMAVSGLTDDAATTSPIPSATTP